jgi:transposase
MSLHPKATGPVPEETAQVAQAAFPKGNRYMQMRDELGIFYEDEALSELFAERGQPALCPWRLALVTVMQYVEGLSDRQAAEAVRGRIDWKYALGLELTDPGFHYSVLCEFRARLVEGDAAYYLLEAMLERFKAKGLLKARGKQRTDSTHVLANIRVINRLVFVAETLRYALNSLAAVVPDWVRAQASPEWYERYSTRIESYDQPRSKAEREALASVIGDDGFRLLSAVFASTAPDWLREIPAVQILHRVWIEQYYVLNGGPARWRDPKDTPPASQHINSPYDIEARYARKRDVTWVGYKVHLTETCDEGTPRLITQVETRNATDVDKNAVPDVHQALEQRELLPEQHLVDGGYVDAEVLVTSQEQYQVDLVGPAPVDPKWQARTDGAFDLTQFAIDWEAQIVTCPEGNTCRVWKPSQDAQGNDVIHIEFKRSDCVACPSRSRCTRAQYTGRQMTLRPREQHLALQAARQRQATRAFKELYKQRAGIEGSISQGTRAFGLRYCRYQGLAKTHLQHVITAVAINLVRTIAWLNEVPLAQTRQSHFAALAH